MNTPQREQAKRKALDEQNLLYRNADSVTDELFQPKIPLFYSYVFI